MKRRWKWWDTTRRDPGAYITVQHLVPNRLGNYETPPGATAWGSGNTVTGTVINADAIQKTDGTARLFACTATKIYEVTSSAVTDRSAGGGTYTTGTHWSCAQYGDATIYTNRAANVQQSSSGAFADLGGTPPKARYACAQSLAVILAAYNDGVNTYEDGIWTSDIGDHTTWTPASNNEASNFRLLQTPGAITGIAPFKGDFLAFKANSFYRVTYVGPPFIWKAVLIDDNVGAAGPGCICVCDSSVVFFGLNGWHVYDGSTVEQIAPSRDIDRVQSSMLAGGTLVYGSRGPRTAVYQDGQTFYHSKSGLAMFAPNWASSSNDETVVAIQAGRGEGYGAFGQFKPWVSGTLTTMRCLVRGTNAAVMGAGIGDSATVGGPYVGAFLVSGTDSVPYTLKDFAISGTSWFQTSWLGDPATKTSWQSFMPIACNYIGNPGAGTSLDGFTSERPDVNDLSMTTAQFTGTLNTTGNSAMWTFSRTSHYVCFASYSTVHREIEDIYVNGVPAGTK